MELNEILSRIEQCKPYIKNWEAIESLNLDYTRVETEALVVDRHEDENGRNWEYSLITTMYSKPDDLGRRDVYSVRWCFRDVWGNLANFIFYGPGTSGSLCLELQDYGDFARVDFSILLEKKWASHWEEEWASNEYDDPLFIFYEPDEISILSVEKKLFQYSQAPLV